MPVERSYVARNDAARARLQALVASLTAESFGRVTHGEWTVGAELAHLAAEDRRIQGWLEEWERQGIDDSAALREWEQRVRREIGDNERRLAQWLAADPRDTAREVVAAATSLDRAIERLSPTLTSALLVTPRWGARRPWVLDRSIHRHG